VFLFFLAFFFFFLLGDWVIDSLGFCLFFACSLPVLRLFFACSSPVLCLFFACSLPVLCLFFACSLPVLCLFFACSLPDDGTDAWRHLTLHLTPLRHRVPIPCLVSPHLLFISPHLLFISPLAHLLFISPHLYAYVLAAYCRNAQAGWGIASRDNKKRDTVHDASGRISSAKKGERREGEKGRAEDERESERDSGQGPGVGKGSDSADKGAENAALAGTSRRSAGARVPHGVYGSFSGGEMVYRGGVDLLVVFQSDLRFCAASALAFCASAHDVNPCMCIYACVSVHVYVWMCDVSM